MFEENQIIGRHYKILKKLGAGGMGAVYKALDVNLGREVAIKFLLKEIAEEKEIVERFLNEGRVIATINHPAVISVYASDIEEKTGMPFLVMEFVDGHSLDHHKGELKSDLNQLIEHFIQMLSGIHACHLKGIVHRDLKPENLLINSAGQLKICDFGIARAASRQTRTGIAIGTPHYMSPEQCMGKQDIISGQTDVYAAGVVLFEMLTGQLPFNLQGKADDPALAIALMHISQKPDFASFASIPEGEEFSELIAKMLEKNPNDRPEIPDIIQKLKEIHNRLFNSDKGPSTPTEAPKSKSSKNIIGDIYQVQGQIGAGGMGTVVKALDTSLNRIVAIKTLHKHSLKDESLVNRFIKEGQVLATVRHKNVMGIYASAKDRDTGNPFLVMEYIEGRPLTDLKATIKKDCSRAVPIMLQLAEGIEAFHGQGIIHRDLKPSNIIITSDGVVKIIDFGIAKTQSNLTKTGMTMGTPEYMSPEQCTGSKNINEKSDIYSLGIIFWELIFGTVPFTPDSNENPELNVALKHIEGTLPAQVLIPDMTLVPIIGLTKRMLDKDPAARPEINQVIIALEDYLREHAPELLISSTTNRRSLMPTGPNSISQLVTEAGQRQPMSKKWILGGSLALLMGVGAGLWHFGILKFENIEEKKARVVELINEKQYETAQLRLQELSTTVEGQKHVPKLREAMSNQILLDAEEAEKREELDEAIRLVALAISVDSANPRSALTLSKLQQKKSKAERLKRKVDNLSQATISLIKTIEPASGTQKLYEMLGELEELGEAVLCKEGKDAWRSKFVNQGEELLDSNPQRALLYFNDLLKYFPEDEEAKEFKKEAEENIASLEEKLAQETMLNSIIDTLRTAVGNYTPGTNAELLVDRIKRVEELGDEATAKELKDNLTSKMVEEANVQIINNPQKAIEILEEVKGFAPTLAGLESKLILAKDSLKSLEKAAEENEKRIELQKQIKAKIAEITPPQPVDELLALLESFKKLPNTSAAQDELRDSLFNKYFDATSKNLEKDNLEEAKTNLDLCSKINPNANLSEIANKIRERIVFQAQEKKRQEALERERQLREAQLRADAAKKAEERQRQEELARAEAAKKAALEAAKRAEEQKALDAKRAEERKRQEELAKAEQAKAASAAEQAKKVAAEKAKEEAARKAKLEAEQKAAQAKAAALAEQKRLEAEKLAAAQAKLNIFVGPSEKFKTISEAVAQAEPGAKITIKAGTYSENLVISKAITLVGENNKSCIIQNRANGPTISLSGKAIISQLSINNKSGNSDSTVIISGDGTISHCIINNSAPAASPDFNAGIEVKNGQPTIANNSVSSAKGMGITVLGGAPEITSNTISDCGIYGLWYNGRAQGSVRGNQIRQNSKSGVGIKSGGAPNFVSNMVVNNNENGLFIYSDGAGKYENNEISSNKMYGLDIWDASTQTLHNNVIDKNRRGGILVRGKKANPRIGTNNFGSTKDTLRNQGGRVTNY